MSLKYYGGYLSDWSYKDEYEDCELDEDDDESDEGKSSDEDNEWDENRRSCPCNDNLFLSRVTSPGWHPGWNEDRRIGQRKSRPCLFV